MFLLSRVVGIAGLWIALGNVRGSVFPVWASVERGPADWNFLLAMPTTCRFTFSFSATTEVLGKVFSVNGGLEVYPTDGFTTPVLVACLPITVETEITDLTKEGFGSVGEQNFRSLLLAGRGVATSLSGLPSCWSTFHDDQDFLALYIQTVLDKGEGLTIYRYLEIPPLRSSEEALSIYPIDEDKRQSAPTR